MAHLWLTAARLLSHATASTSSHSSVCCRQNLVQLCAVRWFTACRSSAARQHLATGLLVSARPNRASYLSTGKQVVTLYGPSGCRHLSLKSLHRTKLVVHQGHLRVLKRHFHASPIHYAPITMLLAPLGLVLKLTKIWLLKPLGGVLKVLTLGNVLRAARTGSMLKRLWANKYARRTLLVVGVGTSSVALVVLVACDFDRAHALAVAHSVPRTIGAAAWATHAAWTYKVALAPYEDVTSAEYLAALHEAHEQCAERLLHLCSRNGGIYVKAAQFLVSLQSIPEVYRSTLEVLQDQADPQVFSDVREALERELGASLESCFAEFEPHARAAASLAQVHKAKLHDGRDVAVKVQYLGLESAVAADLSTLATLAIAASTFFPGGFDFRWLVQQLEKNLGQELDFRLEANNAARLAAYMADNRNVAVPQPVPGLSGKHVLTMEWIDGVKLSDKATMVERRIRPRDAGILLLKAFAEMTFIHGHIHSDPHAGNVLVRPHPGPQKWSWRLLGFGWKEPQLVLLDHGLYLTLSEDLRQKYCELWCSFMVNDREAAAAVGTQLAGEKGGQLLPTLLRPGDLKSEQQRQAFRRRAGINSVADVGRLIEGLPEELTQLLRITAVVRPIATYLGVSFDDRLRVNATYAWKGMHLTAETNPGLTSKMRRLRMSGSIYVLRTIFWLRSLMHDALDAVLYVPISVGHRMFESRYV